jgi:hypothetical protein
MATEKTIKNAMDAEVKNVKSVVNPFVGTT